ncbi:MAG: hypothetical protein K2J83_07265, partial [Clostridia bacterium]|nr:hypothetical protein [Clostridia bacterium]
MLASNIWTALSSGYAILVYAIILLLIVAAIVIYIIVSDNKPPEVLHLKSDGIVPSDGAPKQAVNSGVKDGEEGVRFDGLTKIDESKASYARAGYDEKITLKGLCESFRNYSAGKLKLYYSEDDIRRFISGMAVSHILILQGMSGTGKTSLAYAFGEFLGNTSTVIPVQPMWKERTDLIGYFNEFTKRFNETDLLKKMYEANYSRDIYVTVLDE